MEATGLLSSDVVEHATRLHFKPWLHVKFQNKIMYLKEF